MPNPTSDLRILFQTKLGALNVEMPFTIIASVLGFTWIAVESTPRLFIFSVVFGSFAVAITTIATVIDATLCPSLDIFEVPMGMLLLPWAFGLLIEEPIGGATLASSSGWKVSQMFKGPVLVAVTVLGLVVRWKNYDMRWNTSAMAETLSKLS